MAPRTWGNVVSPNHVPEEISDRQFFQQLAVLELITENEALEAVRTGVLPAALETFVQALPSGDQFSARMLLSGATTFRRSHAMTALFGQLQGMSSDDIDNVWRDAALL
jgi:hypothetical protein